MKPKFKHDCEDCTFVGHFYDHDVYTCNKSVVARYSDEPGEYASMPAGSLVDCLGTDSWIEDVSMRAIVAAVTCQHLQGVPRLMQRFEDIGEVKNAVYKVKWDMLFGSNERDIVPDPGWGLEASTAFNHFYIARSLIEQAEHHLAIADAHDQVCWQKFREKRETPSGQ
jgi:hypothetical protein